MAMPGPSLLVLVLLLLLAGPPVRGPEPPPAACDPQGCYAAFFQRRSFLEAWRGCRELGGDLATLRRPEEAALVGQLLRARGERGLESAPPPGQEAPRRLLWIGLQRQPRQCHPGRPLRGFAWTTGDQDTAYTNWARPAAPGAAVGAACSAARCVVLEEDALRWLDGSCTVAVDGYLCRFPSRGMCPGLAPEGEPGAAAALASVSYSTPFGAVGGGLRYVPFGTVATVACRAGAAVSVLCLQRSEGEDGDGEAVGWSKEPPLCPEASGYPHSWCEGDNGGCQQLCLDEEEEGAAGYSCECHAGYYLLPDGHSCAAASDACRGEPCQFGCVPLKEEEGGGEGGAPGGYQCQCPPGYELAADGHQCEDLDECALHAPCEHQCENTEGSFLCRCHLGFGPSEDEPGQCADTDECQFPGVCQQMCVNYVGGFECYCTEGYELDTDGISCALVAQLPPPATTESYRPGRLQPYGDGQGWPPMQLDLGHRRRHPHHQGDGQGLSDPFPAFQDFSPESGEPPSLYLPDPRVVARMAPNVEPPSASTAPQQEPDPRGSPDLGDLSWTPGATSAPPPPAPRWSPSPPTDGPQDLPGGPPPAPRDPRAQDGPPAPTAPLPPPQQDPTDFPGEDMSGRGSAVWGVAGTPPPTSPPPTAAAPGLTLGGQEGPRKRDDRWLLVALLVPTCVFLVVLLALGIIYCTRCGAQAKARSVAQCYRWVAGSGGKGAAGGAPPQAGPRATCRTSV